MKCNETQSAKQSSFICINVAKSGITNYNQMQHSSRTRGQIDVEELLQFHFVVQTLRLLVVNPLFSDKSLQHCAVELRTFHIFLQFLQL